MEERQVKVEETQKRKKMVAIVLAAILLIGIGFAGIATTLYVNGNVTIEEEQEEIEPTDPTDPEEPIEPTDPTDPTDPEDPPVDDRDIEDQVCIVPVSSNATQIDCQHIEFDVNLSRTNESEDVTFKVENNSSYTVNSDSISCSTEGESEYFNVTENYNGGMISPNGSKSGSISVNKTGAPTTTANGTVTCSIDARISE